MNPTAAPSDKTGMQGTEKFMPTKTLRLSIQPTHDHRKTGDRYTVATFLNDKQLDRRSITDPFVRTQVKVSRWDVIKSLFTKKHLEVCVVVSGDQAIMEDVLELNEDYIGHGNTRRENFKADTERSLRNLS